MAKGSGGRQEYVLLFVKSSATDSGLGRSCPMLSEVANLTELYMRCDDSGINAVDTLSGLANGGGLRKVMLVFNVGGLSRVQDIFAVLEKLNNRERFAGLLFADVAVLVAKVGVGDRRHAEESWVRELSMSIGRWGFSLRLREARTLVDKLDHACTAGCAEEWDCWRSWSSR